MIVDGTQRSFYQRRLFEHKLFKITDTGLRVRTRKYFQTNEYELRYEDIGTIVVDNSFATKVWIAPGIFFCLLSAAIFLDKSIGEEVEKEAQIFYFLIALVCLTFLITSYKRTRLLTKPGNINAIEFLKRTSDSSLLDNFISEILSQRKTFLLIKYGELNENLSYEYQHNNLLWLLENQVLTRIEFEAKKSQLDEMVKARTSFKRYSFGTN